jgi:hypothetical protein
MVGQSLLEQSCKSFAAIKRVIVITLTPLQDSYS